MTGYYFPNVVDDTMRGMETGFNAAESIRERRAQRKAQKQQNALMKQISGVIAPQNPNLGGNPLQAPGSGNMPTMGTPGILPASQQGSNPPASAPPVNPLGGGMSAPGQMPNNPLAPSGMGGRYSQAAQMAAQAGYMDMAKSYQDMASSAQTYNTKAVEAAAKQGATEDEILYRIGKGVMDGEYSLDEAKAFLIQNGADQNELAQLTPQNLPQHMAMMEARLGVSGNSQVLKSNEVIYNPLTGQEVYANRPNTALADGSQLVGGGGQVLAENEKSPDLPTGMRMGPNGVPEYIPSYLEGQKTLRAAGKTTVSVNTGEQYTPGRKKVDEAYAQDYVDWKQGGGSDNAKMITQLDDALDALQSGRNVTGPVLGLTPDALLAIGKPEAVDVKEKVAEVVQRNLRLILGAQFTEKEGKMLIDRAYNPQLPEQVNAKRVKALVTQIKEAAETKEEAAQYFEENGTLMGWKGRSFSISDFEAAIDSIGGNPAQAVDNDRVQSLYSKYGLD